MTIQPLVGKGLDSYDLADLRLNIWEGSVRSSKTVASLIRWLRYVRTGPGGNLVMVGKTERTLKRNVIDVLIDWLGPKRCKYVAGAGELWIAGRRIYLAGANDEKAGDRIRGLTLAGAYVDEASVIPESFWSMLLTRLSVEGAQLFATTNPDNPNHWLMRDYLKRARVHVEHDGKVKRRKKDTLDLARFSFNLRDNPHLSPAYVEALSQEFTGLWRLRFIEGRWVLAEGAIWDNFDPEPGGAHIVSDVPPCDLWVLTVDYGTTNPFVALLLGLDSVGRKVYVAREWRWDSRAEKRQQTDVQYSRALRDWLDDLDPASPDVLSELPGARVPDRVVVDPSAASFIRQLYEDRWAGVGQADNSVDDGIRSVASLLTGGYLKIHESCRGLIDETSGYVWDPKAAASGKEQPLKVDDHGPDALRYGAMATRRWWRHWLLGAVGD